MKVSRYIDAIETINMFTFAYLIFSFTLNYSKNEYKKESLFKMKIHVYFYVGQSKISLSRSKVYD